MDTGKVVMPGDVLLDLPAIENLDKEMIFGPGLRREAGKVIAVKCGVLKQNSSKVYYIDNHQNRYIPSRGENVIGVVIKKGGDEAMVDIGSSEPAIVDLLAFEGATKRNKPALKPGDLLYAKVLAACKDTEAELVCVNKFGKSAGFGLLPEGGFVLPVTLEYCRKLLLPDCPILNRLGASIPFEIAVGLNGRVWVKAKTVDRTLVLVQAITVLEYATSNDVERMCGDMTSINLMKFANGYVQ